MIKFEIGIIYFDVRYKFFRRTKLFRFKTCLPIVGRGWRVEQNGLIWEWQDGKNRPERELKNIDVFVSLIARGRDEFSLLKLKSMVNYKPQFTS